MHFVIFWTIFYFLTSFHYINHLLEKKLCFFIAGNDLDVNQDQLLELQQRLLNVEKENRKRSQELSSALNEIKHIAARRMNMTKNHTGL